MLDMVGFFRDDIGVGSVYLRQTTPTERAYSRSV
jgi:hypothetical protein